MSIKSGDRVRLVRSLKIPKFKVSKNSEGTVDSVGSQIRVRFDGIEHVLSVAHNDIVTAQPEKDFKIDEDVRLLKKHCDSNGKITPEGSVGRVIEVNISGGICRVAFDPNSPIWVLNENLEKV